MNTDVLKTEQLTDIIMQCKYQLEDNVLALHAKEKTLFNYCFKLAYL